MNEIIVFFLEFIMIIVIIIYLICFVLLFRKIKNEYVMLIMGCLSFDYVNICVYIVVCYNV